MVVMAAAARLACLLLLVLLLLGRRQSQCGLACCLGSRQEVWGSWWQCLQTSSRCGHTFQSGVLAVVGLGMCCRVHFGRESRAV